MGGHAKQDLLGSRKLVTSGSLGEGMGPGIWGASLLPPAQCSWEGRAGGRLLLGSTSGVQQEEELALIPGPCLSASQTHLRTARSLMVRRAASTGFLDGMSVGRRSDTLSNPCLKTMGGLLKQTLAP